MLRLPLDQRFIYDPQQNLFFVNFERLPVRSRNDIRALKEAAEKKLAPLGRRVYAIVNYDNFSILPELLDEYSAMVRGLMDRYYSGVSTRRAASCA
jgi:propionate CoA-transferase